MTQSDSLHFASACMCFVRKRKSLDGEEGLRQRREERDRERDSTFSLGIGRHGYGSISSSTWDKQRWKSVWRVGVLEGWRWGGGDSEMLSQRAWMDEPRFRRIVDGKKTSQIGGAKAAFSLSLSAWSKRSSTQEQAAFAAAAAASRHPISCGRKTRQPEWKKKKSTTVKKRTRGVDVSSYSTNNQSASIFQHISRGL